jgi:hypothetical protein
MRLVAVSDVSIFCATMSAYGPEQTWAAALHMSAVGGKADIGDFTAYVAF